MAKTDYDLKLFNEVKEHARELQTLYSARDNQLLSMDDMYLMRWSPSKKRYQGFEMKHIITPDFRNQAMGAVRLLIATDPIIKVSKVSNMEQGAADELEKSLTRMWKAAGRVAKNPLHYDITLSSILYGEIHNGLTSTKDMVTRAKKVYQADKKQKWQVDWAEELNDTIPFLIETYQPRGRYAEEDKFGRLVGYYSTTKTTARQVMQDWGDYLPEEFQNRGRYDGVTLHSFWDPEYRCVWVDDTLILQEEHGLPVIPINVQMTEGSRLFDLPEEQRQPFGYTLAKSGFWDMQCMILTVMYTLIKDMGVTPVFLHQTPPDMPDKQLDLDFDQWPSVVHTQAGESFAPILNKGLADPIMQDGLNLAMQKGVESTIYPQALGAPLAGSGNTFSELSLLSQQGRLPLIGTQRRGAEGIAGLLELTMKLWKDARGGKYEANGMMIDPSTLPKRLELEVKLDVKLPQDKLQLANIANLLKSAKLAPDEWIRSNILNIEDSTGAVDEIWTQEAEWAMFQNYLMMRMEETKMKLQQQQMRQQMQQPPPGEPTMPPEQPIMPGQEAGAEMAPGQGQMIQGGLPPQMAGMMPGQGAGMAMPPEEGIPM